jgi:MinD superfamily P-loop ATPase
LQELVVISGKGGTGKTSITASLAVLAKSAVVADCDVDARRFTSGASPQIKERHQFYAGQEAVIRQADCIACGACLAHCRFDAIKMTKQSSGELSFYIDPIACEGCGVCVRFCPVKAIDFRSVAAVNGLFQRRASDRWYTPNSASRPKTPVNWSRRFVNPPARSPKPKNARWL